VVTRESPTGRIRPAVPLGGGTALGETLRREAASVESAGWAFGEMGVE
jgi:hypothetical protein